MKAGEVQFAERRFINRRYYELSLFYLFKKADRAAET